MPNLHAQLVAHARVSQALEQCHRSPRLDPLRQLDQQPRAGPLVGVAIEGDVLPLGAGVFDQPKQLLRTAGIARPMVEVRDMRRRATPLADLDRLAEGVEEPVAEPIADVRVVEAAESRCLAAEVGELLGRGIRAGRVVEA